MNATLNHVLKVVWVRMYHTGNPISLRIVCHDKSCAAHCFRGSDSVMKLVALPTKDLSIFSLHRYAK